jgi:hypothetical protein
MAGSSVRQICRAALEIGTATVEAVHVKGWLCDGDVCKSVRVSTVACASYMYVLLLLPLK